MQDKSELRNFLESKVIEYNDLSFIEHDPVSIPHRFRQKQDIEISGLFAAIFSWGNRTTIIRKSNELMRMMDNAPYDFVCHHQTADLKSFHEFRHRTFNATDLLYFIRFLQFHYRQSDTLETAFLPAGNSHTVEGNIQSAYTEKKSNNGGEMVKNGLIHFNNRFFSLEEVPHRTHKHIASPDKNSTCKRLNMFLRWMVRKDKRGVDFGIWKTISPADLICPVDLHVARVARRFGLITRKQTDWHTAMELTTALRALDNKDPVKFDFALFGLGVMEKY